MLPSMAMSPRQRSFLNPISPKHRASARCFSSSLHLPITPVIARLRKKPWQSQGSIVFVSRRLVRVIGSPRLPRRFAPRNDKVFGACTQPLRPCGRCRKESVRSAQERRRAARPLAAARISDLDGTKSFMFYRCLHGGQGSGRPTDMFEIACLGHIKFTPSSKKGMDIGGYLCYNILNIVG